MITCYTTLEGNTSDEIFVRDTLGNLNGPYDSAFAAIIDHWSELPREVTETLQYLAHNGYEITNWYHDGAIRLREQNKADYDLNALYMFVKSDGTTTKPRSLASTRAVLALRS